MTHLTIELLNCAPGDRVEFGRTPRGLQISYTRGHQTQSVAVDGDTLMAPYDGYDRLGTILSELRDLVSTIDMDQAAGT